MDPMIRILRWKSFYRQVYVYLIMLASTLAQAVTFLNCVLEVPGSNFQPGLRDSAVFLSPSMQGEG
jgi:hypothetical protein